jgi:small basic protein
MEATLRGDPDLKISPSGPQERVTTSFQPTTWEWTITPEKSGEKSLIIEVNAQLVLGTERNRVQLRTIYETIHVQVHFGHMVLASLLWFVTSIYGLLVGLATLAIGGLGIYQLLQHKKPEEIPGADLLAHQNHKSHDQHAEHHE